MFIKKYKVEIGILLLSALMVGFMFFLNNVNVFIRTKELKLYLQRSDKTDNDHSHMALLAKYKIHKQIYEKKISLKDFDLLQMRVNNLFKSSAKTKKIKMAKYEYISKPLVIVINLFRYLIGKNPIKNMSDMKSNVYLEVAYYYERNSYYKKALLTYDKALDIEKNDRKVISSIILHQGYSHAIIGEYEKAKGKFLTLIRDFDHDEIAIIAATLLRYMEGFKSEVDIIMKTEKDSIEKGEKLYNIIAYKQALKVLKRIEKNVDGRKLARFKYLQGKCLEGLGNKEKAIDNYQYVIQRHQKSRYAKAANRRLYIIGSLMQNGENIKKLAVLNNTLLKDPVMNKMLGETNKLESIKTADEINPVTNYFKDKNIKPEDKILVSNKKITKYVEAINKKLDKKDDKSPTKKKGNLVKQRVRIYTTDGNVFYGYIKRETGKSLILKTTIGDVEIYKSRILKRR